MFQFQQGSPFGFGGGGFGGFNNPMLMQRLMQQFQQRPGFGVQPPPSPMPDQFQQPQLPGVMEQMMARQNLAQQAPQQPFQQPGIRPPMPFEGAPMPGAALGPAKGTFNPPMFGGGLGGFGQLRNKSSGQGLGMPQIPSGWGKY